MAATLSTRALRVPVSPEPSTSHRSERSELSIGEEIEEDLSVGLDDANASDKVRGRPGEGSGHLLPPGVLGAPEPYTD